jgi:autotransporter-associated beta strand protein
MSVYTVAAIQSATLSGSILVNNASFDVEGGDTLTISGGVSGTGGVTKNGTGTLALSGSNSYSGATVVNAGTLNAAHANALGTTSSVTVNNGGSLLVSANGAINGDSITLASASTTVAGLAFSGSYANTSGQAGTLTLSQNSILDLGTGSVVLHFSSIIGLDSYTLAIYNWTGTDGGTGNNTDQFYSDGTALTQSQLNRISFYSGGLGTSSFVGTGYQIIGGSFANQIIPVPEPETYATALVLLLGGGVCMWRTRRANRLSQDLGPSRGNARKPCHRGPSHGDGEPRWSFLV